MNALGTYDPQAAIRSASLAFISQRRISVSEGVADSLRIVQPGGYVGPWSAAETPYMVEPMNCLSNRDHEAVCFIGPSRSGKTMALVDGWVAHAATCDPGDMLIVQMSQEKAREFSKVRIDRAIRNSPKLMALRSTAGHDNNLHDRLFKHGMYLRIGWPSITQLSGSDFRYVALTDYDRMPSDVDGEGAAFNLGLKRVQTYMSRGMCMLESSPGFPVKDPSWTPATEHEAPPADGIFSIYNRSDRRRWYWACPHCAERFEAKPGLGLFTRIPEEAELCDRVRRADLSKLARKYAVIACPHCGAEIYEKSRPKMNRSGVWLRDLEDSAQSSIAGFWLGGAAAAYQSWNSLILRYLQALRDYVATGSELSLKATISTDQGAAYISRSEQKIQKSSPAKRTESFPRFVVPSEARFLTAAVDVQGGQHARFVVQVHAWGKEFEQWPIDRYSLVTSKRPGMGEEFAPIDPSSYPEDWDVLIDKVVLATYRLAGSDRELRIKAIAIDSGGEGEVTENAYAFWWRLRSIQAAKSVMLIKGVSTKGQFLLRESRVGFGHKNTRIPLWLLNTDELKDAVSNSLNRSTPGPAYIHFPDWLPSSFYDELTAEVRQKNGHWKQIRGRNEALDLSVYNRAAALWVGADKINWDSPPPWALLVGEGNSMVVSSETRRQTKTNAAAKPKPRVGFGKEGWAL